MRNGGVMDARWDSGHHGCLKSTAGRVVITRDVCILWGISSEVSRDHLRWWWIMLTWCTPHGSCRPRMMIISTWYPILHPTQCYHTTRCHSNDARPAPPEPVMAALGSSNFVALQSCWWERLSYIGQLWTVNISNCPSSDVMRPNRPHKVQANRKSTIPNLLLFRDNSLPIQQKHHNSYSVKWILHTETLKPQGSRET